ncbi:MAG: hypothetical protein JO227_24150 [Acetobacteraceae bacterium]|nr:hypothetical protein [Acetobacteraceae bacterium]
MGAGTGCETALLAAPKLKALLRKAGESTVEATWPKIGDSLDAFSAAECSNYLANSRFSAVSS